MGSPVSNRECIQYDGLGADDCPETSVAKQKMIRLIQEKHIYTSPGVIKWVSKIEQIEDYIHYVGVVNFKVNK